MRKLFFVLSLVYVFSVIPRPILSFEISNFFTPYYFSTPQLKQGQGAFGFRANYNRSKSKSRTENYKYKNASISKNYYFSLNGIYAISNQLAFEGNLYLYPGQTTNTWWSSQMSYDSTEFKEEGKSHNAVRVSPRLNVSFKPKTNIEFFGSFNFYPRTHTKYQSGQYISHNWHESYSIEFGFTILNGP